MKYDAEVKISLKKGMLNPEAATIQRALALLEYQVENTATVDVIKFSLEGQDQELLKKKWMKCARDCSATLSSTITVLKYLQKRNKR